MADQTREWGGRYDDAGGRSRKRSAQPVRTQRSTTIRPDGATVVAETVLFSDGSKRVTVRTEPLTGERGTTGGDAGDGTYASDRARRVEMASRKASFRKSSSRTAVHPNPVSPSAHASVVGTTAEMKKAKDAGRHVARRKLEQGDQKLAAKSTASPAGFAKSPAPECVGATPPTAHNPFYPQQQQVESLLQEKTRVMNSGPYAPNGRLKTGHSSTAANMKPAALPARPLLASEPSAFAKPEAAARPAGENARTIQRKARLAHSGTFRPGLQKLSAPMPPGDNMQCDFVRTANAATPSARHRPFSSDAEEGVLAKAKSVRKALLPPADILHMPGSSDENTPHPGQQYSTTVGLCPSTDLGAPQIRRQSTPIRQHHCQSPSSARPEASREENPTEEPRFTDIDPEETLPAMPSVEAYAVEPDSLETTVAVAVVSDEEQKRTRRRRCLLAVAIALILNVAIVTPVVLNYPTNSPSAALINTTHGPSPPSDEAEHCISNTTDIRDLEYGVTDPTTGNTRVYVLCPHTVFEIGDWNLTLTAETGISTYVGGMPALELMYPNVHIRCGSDGRRSNNCIFQGGGFQVWIWNRRLDAKLSKVMVDGITFQNSGAGGGSVIRADARSDAVDKVTFKDCVFTENVGPLFGIGIFDYEDRDTGGATLTFESCSFDSNRPSSDIYFNEVSTPFRFLWTMFEGQRMIIDDCEFTNNQIQALLNTQGASSYLVGNFGGILEVSKSTFENNTVSMALILERDGSQTTIHNNIAKDNVFVVDLVTGEHCDGLAELNHISNDTSSLGIACTKFDGPGCYTDTTDIFDDLKAKDPNVGITRTYTLCPDTTFNIGSYDENLGRFVNGMAMLTLRAPNIRIMCGDDGSRENNCVLQGGSQQVAILNFTSAPLTNVLVSGVTFVSAEDVVVIADSPTEQGGIVFNDCVFKGNTDVVDVIFIGGTSMPLAMTVQFNSCTFDSNTARHPTINNITGRFYDVTLVANFGQSVTIANCNFVNNQVMLDISDNASSHLVGNQLGGRMVVTDSIFRNNTVSIAFIYEYDSDRGIYVSGNTDPLNANTAVSGNIAVGNTFIPTSMTDKYCNGLAAFNYTAFYLTKIFKFDCTDFG